ncbi:DUF2605 domain-containing protein [Pannus brasiliensis CCIBt3594]|uniref:DUF2605 domain-containing protein n=1 Tax=Pannus brasiliensis CCIBt3594 TaxID=1427578 RepID=A0AAW9QDC3_9CHRO
MYNSRPTENELLKAVLEPLLEDFREWFSRARALLETERLSFLSIEEQEDLLDRVKRSQQEVATADALYRATGGQAGIEARMLFHWHQLVAECWRVSSRWRSFRGKV